MTSKTTTRDIPAADTNIGLGTARKPVKRPWRERFRRFFYNKEEGSYLGRTPLSWIQILLFYFFFFACLLGFWMLCWFMFSATMTEMSKGPRWQIEKSVIGKNPGVGIRPKTKDKKLEQKANFRHRVTFSSTKQEVNKDYAKDIQEALQNYTRVSSKDAKFLMSDLGECGQDPYMRESPVKICVYLKLNRIWGWKPAPIDSTDVIQAGVTWPEDFVRHWRNQENEQFVWISCDALNSADLELIENLEYFPANRGIALDFFPFSKTFSNASNLSFWIEEDVQMPPLVAVRITPSSSFPDNTPVVIECRAYYKGVVHVTKMGKQSGLVQFELFSVK